MMNEAELAAAVAAHGAEVEAFIADPRVALVLNAVSTSQLIMWLIHPSGLVKTLEDVGAIEPYPPPPDSPTREHIERHAAQTAGAIFLVTKIIDTRVPTPAREAI